MSAERRGPDTKMAPQHHFRLRYLNDYLEETVWGSSVSNFNQMFKIKGGGAETSNLKIKTQYFQRTTHTISQGLRSPSFEKFCCTLWKSCLINQLVSEIMPRNISFDNLFR